MRRAMVQRWGCATNATGRITRWTRVGFEIRLEVTPDDVLHPEPVQVALTRTEATALQLHEGDQVWLRPRAGAEAVAR